jgi:hypothetical protein
MATARPVPSWHISGRSNPVDAAKPENRRPSGWLGSSLATPVVCTVFPMDARSDKLPFRGHFLLRSPNSIIYRTPTLVTDCALGETDQGT